MTRLASYGVAVLALIAAACAGVAWHQKAVHQVASAAAQAERDLITSISNKALLAAEQRVARLETEAAIAALENQVEQNHLKDQARASSERARTADQRLQLATDDLRRRATAAGQDPGSGSFAHEAAAAAAALGECGREYRSVAEVADELSIQVTGLQRYVSSMLSVCRSNQSLIRD